jgi:sporulation protein YlmC with PRC-barrel domain
MKPHRTVGFMARVVISSLFSYPAISQEPNPPTRPAAPLALRVVQTTQTPLPAAAAPAADPIAPAPTPRADAKWTSHQRLGHLVKATDVMGNEVANLNGEKIGKVEEMAVDLETGRIVHVILSSGGVLGIGEKRFAVPPRAFTSDSSEKALQLTVREENLKAAPQFEIKKWDEHLEPARVLQVYRYYGQEPDFSYDGTARTRLGHVLKASEVIGYPVRNQRDEKLGKVNNLMLDLGAARIVYVIVASGGFLGLGDELSAVPPTAIRDDPSRHALLLNVSKEELGSAPHFKRSECPDFSDPAYASGVYHAYRVQPYFSTKPRTADAGNTPRNRQDRLTPIDQGTNEADVATTRRIREEIMARKGLSVHARNVKIIALNGRVILRGPVNSEEEKRIIDEIATRNAQRENVDNHLEVKPEGD